MSTPKCTWLEPAGWAASPETGQCRGFCRQELQQGCRSPQNHQLSLPLDLQANVPASPPPPWHTNRNSTGGRFFFKTKKKRGIQLHKCHILGADYKTIFDMLAAWLSTTLAQIKISQWLFDPLQRNSVHTCTSQQLPRVEVRSKCHKRHGVFWNLTHLWNLFWHCWSKIPLYFAVLETVKSGVLCGQLCLIYVQMQCLPHLCENLQTYLQTSARAKNKHQNWSESSSKKVYYINPQSQ